MGARFRTEQGNEEQESETIHGYVLGADPDFFKMFNFPILQGNDKTPLIDPNGVYISEDFAQRLFGEENPIGKPIYFVNYEDKYVAGILKDPPINSHIRFSAIYPIDLERNPIWWDSWTNAALAGYIQVEDGINIHELQEKITVLSHEKGFAKIWNAEFIPMKDIHLKSEHLSFNLLNSGHKNPASILPH